MAKTLILIKILTEMMRTIVLSSIRESEIKDVYQRDCNKLTTWSHSETLDV